MESLTTFLLFQGSFQFYIQVSDDTNTLDNRVANIFVNKNLSAGSTSGPSFYPAESTNRIRIELSFQVHCVDNFTGK